MNKPTLAIAFVLGAALAGCTPPPQSVIINPQGYFASGQAGRGQAITVAVSAAPGVQTVRNSASPKIVLQPSNDYVGAVGQALIKGFKLQGYNAASGYGGGTAVTVTIQKLTTDIVKGTTTDEVHAEAALAVAIGNTTYTFAKSMVRDIPLKADEQSASKTANDLLGQLVSDVINSPKVQGALSSSGPY